jgi:putative ABC transport system ATP-binding protein
MTTMTPAAEIEVDAVSKHYPDGSSVVTALASVSCEIRPGAFVALVGPSGSGKTTLLNLIAGLDTPSAGRVRVIGTDLVGLSDARRSALRLRHIGIVFQAFNLLPGFTVEENVSWPLGFLDVGRRAARARAVEILSDLGISDAMCRRWPAELSGGEQQRVALARALVTEPRLLLADEPTGNLDARSATAILDLLRTLNRERGLTVVLVTHNPVAAAYATRTIALCDGHLDGVAGTNARRIPSDPCAIS